MFAYTAAARMLIQSAVEWEKKLGDKLIKEGPDCLKGWPMPRNPKEVKPTQEKEAECEPRRSLTEEPVLRPQAVNTITADKEDGSASVLSAWRALEAEADVGEDEEA
ncbi:hypothetical protein NDU88_005232 [Pleurodeles waltl]|uniref:Uncharacterized protein n=1 Tax=Pleurodeles waltl TaxID=8319 RepID=A0AAV7LWU1_PLEWA|nr:hypothetical protein NDU88_005232 [Pleurodeles waltl]